MARQLEFGIRSWGGRRAGAGRPPRAGRRPVAHRARAPHGPRCPAHVTLRAARGIPTLRGDRVFAAVRGALSRSSNPEFRVVHFSVQGDHVHMMIEADTPTAFTRGCQGLAIRVAKAVNRTLGRVGCVWGDRYHARLLETPRAVRNALVYVLNNWRKHIAGARGIDLRSSAPWFDGWSTAVAAATGLPIVAVARTWLARVGWRRHGPIAIGEAPAIGRR